MNEFPRLAAFLAILSILRAADCSVHEKYAGEANNVYHDVPALNAFLSSEFPSRYTRNVHDPELLIPRRVHSDGKFHTYSLPNYYDCHEVERKKRSAQEPDKVHLVLPFSGLEHHVELSPYHEFISPEFVIERRSAGVSKDLASGLRFKRADQSQCHYRGRVRGHDNSKAALSLCDGVVGYVQTNHGRYFIEPVHEAKPEADGQLVHIAYKRKAPHENHESADTATKRHCGTNENWEEAWTEQLAKRQKRLMENNSIATKRQVSSGTHSVHRYIELGLVADRKFLDFHNNTNYEQYLLTIMNMVSDFYHDSSAGNQIDVVLVRMIYLEKEKEEIDLSITPAAEDTLASFAKWAEKMNPKDFNHPNHYDIAALVTRYDICSEGTNCDLMGLAYVAAACDPPKAACINEDSGLLLGIVIAHEVGHVMGCSHDEIESSGCPPQDKDDSYFVMSPIVFIFTIRWSTCSRKFITSFLESGLGECLNDDPRNPPERFKYPNMLPGAMYDANFQCQMEYPNSKLCPRSPADDCSALWCLKNSSCYTRRVPMADGTKCGENKWCIQKKCVEMGRRPDAVHGGWGEWGPMSTCTRTCGGGVKYSERECDKPVPANGGRYCIGERKKISLCNTTPCDPSKPSFRALQCAEHDNEPILTDGLHQWKPYNAPELDPCVLNCINEKRTFVKILPTVNDSTPCKPGTNYMCLSGTCRKVGCDWIIDSDAIEDKCGVCKGDGTKCTSIEGDFANQAPRSGYQKVATVPKGARSIQVIEQKPSQNSLAIKLEKSETYCLNANFREERSGDYSCAGTMIIYTHPEPEREEIEMKGPISEDIQIQYVFFDVKDNPGVHYKYYVTSTNSSYTPKYLWDFMEWSECSAKCGGGTSISEASCIEEQGGKVSPDFCKGISRPQAKSRTCNEEACPAKWRVSQWSKCSACDGKKGTRHRKVQCVRPSARSGEDDIQANLDACKGRVPKQEEECTGTRPCKKTCSKATREVKREASESQNYHDLSADEERRMIDDLVDLGLTRYLKRRENEKRREFREAKRQGRTSSDYQRILRDWPFTETKKRESVCQSRGAISTPKPGSIVKDTVPKQNIVLIEAPYTNELLESNFSDKAYQESGDHAGMSIDTSREKVYQGDQAIKMIEQLTHRNSSTTVHTPKSME